MEAKPNTHASHASSFKLYHVFLLIFATLWANNDFFSNMRFEFSALDLGVRRDSITFFQKPTQGEF